MEIKQLYPLVNQALKETLGETAILNEDLSNIIELGDEVFNANEVDSYTKTLVNHIGKVIFVNRPYDGEITTVLHDGWEYGSVLEKIRMPLMDAELDEMFELEDGKDYTPFIHHQPKVTAKFFNGAGVFRFSTSIAREQVKQSFQSASQLNNFVELIYSTVQNSMTMAMQNLIKRTVNNLTGITLAEKKDNPDSPRAVNLAEEYYISTGIKVASFEKAMKDPEFIRFVTYRMKTYVERLKSMSTLFNIGGVQTHTPSELLHIVLLNDFRQAADVFLQSISYNQQFTALPKAETVSSWQGTGKAFDIVDASTIDLTVKDYLPKSQEKKPIKQSGIIGVMFDHDALGVCNELQVADAIYNPRVVTTNLFWHYKAQYFNDTNENFVVFYVDPSTIVEP